MSCASAISRPVWRGYRATTPHRQDSERRWTPRSLGSGGPGASRDCAPLRLGVKIAGPEEERTHDLASKDPDRGRQRAVAGNHADEAQRALRHRRHQPARERAQAGARDRARPDPLRLRHAGDGRQRCVRGAVGRRGVAAHAALIPHRHCHHRRPEPHAETDRRTPCDLQGLADPAHHRQDRDAAQGRLKSGYSTGDSMQRRSFLQAGAAASLLGSLPRLGFAQQLPFDPKPSGWRTFEITTRVEILKPQGVSRAWVPLPSVESDYQKVIGSSWSGNGSARLASDGKYGANMVAAEWGASEKAPVLEVVS